MTYDQRALDERAMTEHTVKPRGYGPNSYRGPCGGKHVVGYNCFTCMFAAQRKEIAMSLEKGTRFDGPDGQGYELTRAVQTGDAIEAAIFKAYGGAPEAKAGHAMPEWLAEEIRRKVEAAKSA